VVGGVMAEECGAMLKNFFAARRKRKSKSSKSGILIPSTTWEKALATAQANGITIAYETSGNPLDPPVLLIMGLGMQLIAWPQDFIDGLVEQGYYVIRFDNRDIGLSSKLDHHKNATSSGLIQIAGRPDARRRLHPQ
jgi:alpha-beta hydrolase superfamily lysophospholipase